MSEQALRMFPTPANTMQLIAEGKPIESQFTFLLLSYHIKLCNTWICSAFFRGGLVAYGVRALMDNLLLIVIMNAVIAHLKPHFNFQYYPWL